MNTQKIKQKRKNTMCNSWSCISLLSVDSGFWLKISSITFISPTRTHTQALYCSKGHVRTAPDSSLCCLCAFHSVKQYGMLGIICIWIINLMLRVNEIEIRQFVWDSEFFLLLNACSFRSSASPISTFMPYLLHLYLSFPLPLDSSLSFPFTFSLYIYTYRIHSIIFLCVSHPSCFGLSI